MVDKIRGKKIAKVKENDSMTETSKTAGVSSVTKVSPTEGVNSAGKVDGARRRAATRTMTAQERDRLFSMIDEEVEQMFGDSSSKRKKEVAGAVKMAIDAGIVEEEK